jgi:hypothetical protein
MSHSQTLARGLFAVTLLVTAPALVEAKDYCISLQSGAAILVAQGFVLPDKGKCKTVNSFIQGDPDGRRTTSTSPAPARLFAGNACTTSDGTIARFNLFGSSFGPESFNFTLRISSLTGSGADCLAGHPCTSFTTAAVACDPSTVAVP